MYRTYDSATQTQGQTSSSLDLLLNFVSASYLLNQMFLSVKWYAEPMIRLCRLNVRVIVQGCEFDAGFISPEPFEQVTLNFTKMLISVC